uniref:Uncharacterized protein n=1 Tax=Romanomermis culicivorax TaxID=13658 RepID=A0A915KUX3_ROMCU
MVDCRATYTIIDEKITDKIENIEIKPTTVVPIAANNLGVELADSTFITAQAEWSINNEKGFVRLGNTIVPCTGVQYQPSRRRGGIHLDQSLILQPRSVMEFFVPIADMYK